MNGRSSHAENLMIPSPSSREPVRTTAITSERASAKFAAHKGLVPLTIVLRSHTIDCQIANSDHRVLDILNDLGSGFLKVSNVRLHEIEESGSLGPLEEAVIPKSSIDCVLLDQELHEAPVRRRHSLVPKHQRATFVLLPHHELCGMTNWAGRPESLALLATDAPRFFPVSAATLWGANRQGEPLASPVAFVNKLSVSMLSLGDR
ncbi:hypothetical protein AYO47_02655 [Planctomyces sp. SCGC AG-212-M04]|nr:hypothetical protein AYO47_02655 [Planctomyces sp. SCGC AG-212-M04]